MEKTISSIIYILLPLIITLFGMYKAYVNRKNVFLWGIIIMVTGLLGYIFLSFKVNRECPNCGSRVPSASSKCYLCGFSGSQHKPYNIVDNNIAFSSMLIALLFPYLVNLTVIFRYGAIELLSVHINYLFWFIILSFVFYFIISFFYPKNKSPKSIKKIHLKKIKTISKK